MIELLHRKMRSNLIFDSYFEITALLIGYHDIIRHAQK